MKTSSNYAQTIKKLFTELKKNGTKITKKPAEQDFIQTLVTAVLCQNSPESAAAAALKKIQAHFVDFNDLRVARQEEIIEVIGKDIENPQQSAQLLTGLLNSIFHKYDCLEPEEIISGGKKEVKEILEKLNGITPFICGYVMLNTMDGHAIPLTDKMIDYLKDCGAVDAKAKTEQVCSFVERQITSANGYTFYQLVRHDSELVSPKAAKFISKKSAKTTAKKTKAKPKK